jgi:hypothetical protein
MSIFKKETTEQRTIRIVMRVFAIICGLLILLIVATNPSVFEELTIDDVTALRGAAMVGFMGWMFVFVGAIRPRK